MLGAAKKCAKCDKLVYPVEELKCLDKCWHKQCFKCSVCGMVLNMKNYKGFDKQPYCATHYPQQKHTVVPDNPEMQRIKENTKIQSNVKYHEDFEKSKNKYKPIADTIETTRAIENQKLVSSIEYKGLTRHRSSDSHANEAKNASNIQPVTYKAGEKQIESATTARKIGSIADYDPLQHEYSNYSTNNQNMKYNSSNNYKNSGIINSNDIKNNDDDDYTTTVYRAIYDHDANEDDEISFRDGDRFIECQHVDVGWMVGVHEKTGKYGFFPSNYVEPINTL